MKLMNVTKNKVVMDTVVEARTFWQRLCGLMGQASLDSRTAFWFDQCNSIHTHFMRFSIDVIFVNSEMRVHCFYENVKPWRTLWPVKNARGVFELRAGLLKQLDISVGDQLHVVS